MNLGKIQLLNITLALSLGGCETTAPVVFSSCPPSIPFPVDYDVQWPELRFRYPLDGPILLSERTFDDGRGPIWHIIVGFPEIYNWDFCQTFFENQGLEVHYTNNIIYMRQVK